VPAGDDVGHSRGQHGGMSLPPDQMAAVRLRMTISRELDERGLATPVQIGEALGMQAAEANSLLTRRQWREGDVARLEVAADRLGVQVPAKSHRLKNAMVSAWRVR
jgi:hypothetical protein